MTSKRLVLASGNAGKLRELAGLLAGRSIDVVSQADFATPPVAETGSTFVENAVIKARHAAAHCGLPALADDSGLVVDALAGRPGVYSARYAGEGADDSDNNRRLLAELEGVPVAQRRARFCCALVLMRHAGDPMPICCFGRWEGSIALSPRGDGGFGYDPLFLPDDAQVSAAELDAATKNRLSHRGQALRALLTALDGQG